MKSAQTWKRDSQPMLRHGGRIVGFAVSQIHQPDHPWGAGSGQEEGRLLGFENKYTLERRAGT